MNRISGDEPAYPWFAGLLSDFDELLRLKAQTSANLRQAREISVGFAMFVDAVLPRDAGAEGRIARALRLNEKALRQLRRRELDPSELPADALATLARCASLDWATFDRLVERDLLWFSTESPLAMLRDNTADPAEVRRALRAAWERDALDTPRAVEND